MEQTKPKAYSVDIMSELKNNEQARLDQLFSFGILDTLKEENFDRLAELVKVHYNVPVALISFIDTNRQWFKSCIGIEDVTETPRDIAFCHHAIKASEPFIVQNALEHPTFSDNPLVTEEPHIRFYAGAPLIVPSGEILGTLCLIDLKPRPDFKKEDTKFLTEIASIVVDELLLRRDVLEREKSIARKLGFMTHMSHELRTPLGAILGSANILDGFELSEEAKPFFNAIHTSALHMNKIIDSLLDFTKYQNPHYEFTFESCSCDGIMSDILEILEVEAQQKNLVIIYDNPNTKDVSWICDELRVKQILINLIGNAIKYTDKGHIKIETSLSDRGEFVCKIEDTGMGISKEEIPHIFEPFSQNTNRDTHHKTGTGLGLPITKLLVEKMGGTITVESKKAKGSIFTISLPLEFASEPKTAFAS